MLLQEASSDYDYEHLPLMQPYMARLNELYPYRSHGYHDVSILSRYPYEVVPDTLMRQTAENNPKSYHVYAKAFDVQLPQGRQLRVISTHLQSIGLTDSDKHTYENITRLDSVASRAQLSQVRHSIYGKLSGAFQRRTAEARVMRNFIDGCPPNLIVCGDFNDVPASSGELYAASDNTELLERLRLTSELCHDYNQLRPSQVEERQALLRRILGATGQRFKVMQPFFCDYGFNITIGEDFFANTGLVILDEATVTFGDHVFLGPNCGFYTAGHPLDVERRNAGLQYSLPIVVGDNVWMGGNVCVMPGVTIGSNTVIAAGSVVAHDIPAGVLAAGNPCRVIRVIDQHPEEKSS